MGVGTLPVSAEPTSPVWAFRPVSAPGCVSGKPQFGGDQEKGTRSLKLKVESVPGKVLKVI